MKAIRKTFSCVCIRCGHQWGSRIEEGPSSCPNCKSVYWDVPIVGRGQTLHEH